MIITTCKRCKENKKINKHGYCRGCFNVMREVGKHLDKTMSPNIDRNKTLEQFGYDPFYLSHNSGLEVIRVCPECKTERVMRKEAANKYEWCIACRGKERVVGFHEAQIKYKTPGEKAEAEKRNDRNYYLRHYIPTPRRKGMTHEEANAKLNAYRKQKRLEDVVYRVRMSVTTIINQYLRRKEIGRKKRGNTLLNIGIEKEGLRKHMVLCLEKGCIICGQPINDKWHLAHLKPLAMAKTVDEVYASFRLHNLAVAHPHCNLSVGPREFKPFYQIM
jgi:hypothetical protein